MKKINPRTLICCNCARIVSPKEGKQTHDIFLCNKCYKDIKKLFPIKKEFEEFLTAL